MILGFTLMEWCFISAVTSFVVGFSARAGWDVYELFAELIVRGLTRGRHRD